MSLSDAITSQDLFKPEFCKMIASDVLALREHWRGRGTFWTLGASTYNDDVMAYMGIAWQDNAILTRYFGAVLQELANTSQALLNKPVIFLHTHGLPGFHIFDQSANGLEGSIHIDQPESRCWWPCKTTDHFTFTVPLELPQGQGGLNLYVGNEETIKSHTGPLPNPEYYPYEVGKLYIHDGQTIHQIANPVDMETNQYRITLQGHGATLSNGQVVLYF